MRKKLAFAVMAVALLTAPVSDAQWRFDDPCRTYSCWYESYGDIVECRSSRYGMGQWYDCHVDSNCSWYYESGWSWTCRPECHGSECMEV